MSDFTTVRVGQLPEEIWSGTDKLPHEVGTDLKSGTVADLAIYIAGIIESSAGLAFNPLKISDGQTLPETTINEWIIVGKGTYLQNGGFSNVVCIEDINIVLSNGISWSFGFGINIYNDITPSVDFIQIIDFPLLTTNDIQDFEIPLGKVAIEAYVNDAIQYKQTANNATRGNTFTQSGTTVTFAQATEINNYISIKIQ